MGYVYLIHCLPLVMVPGPQAAVSTGPSGRQLLHAVSCQLKVQQVVLARQLLVSSVGGQMGALTGSGKRTTLRTRDRREPQEHCKKWRRLFHCVHIEKILGLLSGI